MGVSNELLFLDPLTHTGIIHQQIYEQYFRNSDIRVPQIKIYVAYLIRIVNTINSHSHLYVYDTKDRPRLFLFVFVGPPYFIRYNPWLSFQDATALVDFVVVCERLSKRNPSLYCIGSRSNTNIEYVCSILGLQPCGVRVVEKFISGRLNQI